MYIFLYHQLAYYCGALLDWCHVLPIERSSNNLANSYLLSRTSVGVKVRRNGQNRRFVKTFGAGTVFR